MPKYSDNLRLTLPKKDEYFDITTWNNNMRLLDEAYALLTGSASKLSANLISYDNSKSKLKAANVQEAIDEVATGGGGSTSELYFITATTPTTITAATYGHTYVVLSFGSTVPAVTFEQSIPSSGKSIVWQGGEPTFEPNSTYELSFLHLNCKWFKR